MVYNHLRNEYHKEQIFYHKINGQEIDFVTTSQGKVGELIQVCENLASPETRQREIPALSSAMGELSFSHAFIITRSERGEEKTETGVIHIMPFWEWAIEFSKRGSAEKTSFG
ncbi:MAG: hypothetical protein GWP06_01870 [Actinobacteria bacterium]|nr:hypothetical protein [Actinomycetota bacterium]